MRSSAYKDEATDLVLNGTDKQLQVLELLSRYDLLQSSYIFHETGNYHATRTLLTNLRKGGYIGFPDLPYQEKLAYIPRNSNYVYELKPKGKLLLAMKDRWRARPRGNDHFKHKLLRSQVEYALDHSPLKVLHPEDILAHPNCPQATKDDPYPWQLTQSNPKLTPDITRGFQFGGGTVFLHVEVDRGTEPEETTTQRQSITEKLKRYNEYLTHRVYFKRYGIPERAPPTILFLTLTDNRKERIKAHAKKYPHPRFAFASVPDLIPETQLLGTWDGFEQSINLMEILRGHKPSETAHRAA